MDGSSMLNFPNPMKMTTLPDFLEFLNSQTKESLRGPAVDDYLRDHRFGEDDFLPFIYFREDTYGRNLVFKTDNSELLVLTWLPHHRTAIHDHSGQRCWMLVQAGALTFKTFHPVPHDVSKVDLKPMGPVETHCSGDAVYIDDGIGVHSIANASSKPAVSVHLYAGPIGKCRIYNESLRRFEQVELEYFTQYGEVLDRSSEAHP